MFPLTDPVEMASHEAVAVKHIKRIKGYRPYFKEAFGDEKITLTRIFEAIATYERTIVSGKTSLTALSLEIKISSPMRRSWAYTYSAPRHAV